MKKQVIDHINKCYSVNALNIKGETMLLFAGEGDGSLSIYSGNDFGDKTVIWNEEEKLGGTMTICVAEDKEGYFFASTGFFTMIQSETSSIYLIRYQNGNYKKVKVCDIPYLHRFDVITVGERRYLIACTIHSGKSSPEDWENPGKILTAEIPFDLDGDVSVEPIVLKEGLTQNHGFNRIYENGQIKILVAARNGVFKVTPPESAGKDWRIDQLFSFPASDVCAYDLDGDGELEYGIISPFHGNCFCVYKLMDGKAVKLYEHEKKLDFYHAIYADKYYGKACFVIGARKEEMDLYFVWYDAAEKKCKTETIEVGAGSSNVRIIHASKGDFIISANRQKDEAAIYYEE